jgi:CRP/FNR family cyclic AMP-dependent transcriptional regulator
MQSDASTTLMRSLDTIKLFSDLTPELRSAIEERCRWTTARRDQVILVRDDCSRNVYFVASGTVRVTGYSEDGGEHALGDVAAGEMFGELTAIDGDDFSAHVVGDEDCTIGILSKQDFRAILAELPQVTLRLLDDLANFVRGAGAAKSAAPTVTPRQRVFAELIDLAVPSPIGDGSWLIDTMPNHDELAGRSGTEKTEVAMAIGTLARDGIIERKHRTLVIRDYPRLRMLANM